LTTDPDPIAEAEASIENAEVAALASETVNADDTVSIENAENAETEDSHSQVDDEVHETDDTPVDVVE